MHTALSPRFYSVYFGVSNIILSWSETSWCLGFRGFCILRCLGQQRLRILTSAYFNGPQQT
jgi:hypothetical protein